LAKTVFALVTDTYWPSRGGVEEWVRSIASHLPSDFDAKIITHPPPEKGNDSLIGNTVCSPSAPLYRDPEGHEVQILSPYGPERLALLPLAIWQVPFVRRFAAKNAYDALYKWYRKAFKVKLAAFLSDARIVHCFSTGYLARLTGEICIGSGIPLIMSPAVHFGKWGDSKEQMNAYCRANAVICLTNHMKAQLIARWDKTIPARCEVVPPPVAEPKMVSLEKDPLQKPFVLFLGRKEVHKGLTFLLSVLGKLARPVKLAVAGPGGPVDTCGNDVIDLGEVDDATKRWLLYNCELLCVPSTDETFGIVYAEAMSCRKPVIALRVPPIDEIVEDGKTGLLVQPGDADGLRKALDLLLLDKDLSRRMGEAGYNRYLEKYSVERVISQILKVYSEVLKGKST
jgi:glycosyltransferase involved in cell wall biosynthesis